MMEVYYKITETHLCSRRQRCVGSEGGVGQRSSICKHLLSVTASIGPDSQSGGPTVNFDQPNRSSSNYNRQTDGLTD